jgi:hypothetical protein
LAEGLGNVFHESVTLLPRQAEAAKAGKPLPKHDPARLAFVCGALSFVEGGRPQFMTLAHLEDGKISFQMQEALVWMALDATTCASIEEQVPGAARATGLFRGFGSRAKDKPDPTLMKAYSQVLMRNTQNIAIRAAFLARFVRFAIEYMAHMTPANRFAPAPETAQRYFEAYQSDIERHVSCFVDRQAAANLCQALSFPFAPVIIAELEDKNCERLNGVPMSAAHKAAWLQHFGEMQAGAMAQAAG